MDSSDDYLITYYIIELTRSQVDLYFTKYDLKRLDMYSNKLVDYHLIMDLLPHLAKLYFTGKMSTIRLSVVQQVNTFLVSDYVSRVL